MAGRAFCPEPKPPTSANVHPRNGLLVGQGGRFCRQDSSVRGKCNDIAGNRCSDSSNRTCPSLSHGSSLGKAIREDRPQYPFAALREGLTNAIIHRDYAVVTGGMAVGVYPRSNPDLGNTGRLPQGWKLGDLRKDHPSQPANPHMVHVFYLRGMIERIGRGTLKILDECKAAGLRPPQWKETAGGITLIFYGERQRAHLNPRQRRLLERLRRGGELRPGDYYAEVEGEVSQRQAQRDLSQLGIGRRLLRKEGEGPSTVDIRTDQAGA